MTFMIECKVSGGVTGYRCALLKGADGQIAEYDSREDAQEIANRFNVSMNGPNRTASFRYTVVES